MSRKFGLVSDLQQPRSRMKRKLRNGAEQNSTATAESSGLRLSLRRRLYGRYGGSGRIFLVELIETHSVVIPAKAGPRACLNA